MAQGQILPTVLRFSMVCLGRSVSPLALSSAESLKFNRLSLRISS